MNGIGDNFESIISGKLPGAEIVIGLIGPVGTDLKFISKCLSTKLKMKYKYSVDILQMSDFIKHVATIPRFKPRSEYHRTDALMTAGDNARKETGHNAILALVLASLISSERQVNQEGKTQPREHQAYIVNSLKHPEEVNTLRKIYGSSFFLIGVYMEQEQRKERLIHEKNMTPEQAEALMKRDETEGMDYGQRTRDTFHLSDYFVPLEYKDRNLDKDKKTVTMIERFLEIIFAHPFRTPLFDEYAMFMAFAAATRSADLSRQIGAVIAKDEEILASGVNECPRFGGGTYWPKSDRRGHVVDTPNGRDYTIGYDRNDKEKTRIIADAIEEMKVSWAKSGNEALNNTAWDILQEALGKSTIDDITEYGRVVHAEMDALLTCARNNISCRGATLYSTTFPCHNCAKHIIAAGIDRVVYVEPYPKSKALEFHTDSAFSGFRNSNRNNKVAFEPFVGVGPRRFYDLFSMKEGSGFPLKRKDKRTGEILKWKPEHGTIRIPELPWSYLVREEFAARILEPYLKGREQ